jgi:hypothetical protein
MCLNSFRSLAESNLLKRKTVTEEARKNNCVEKVQIRNVPLDDLENFEVKMK